MPTEANRPLRHREKRPHQRSASRRTLAARPDAEGAGREAVSSYYPTLCAFRARAVRKLRALQIP
jgi:hypothetical protein